MNTFDAFRKRCSLKLHISPQPIEQHKLCAVLDAARLAPSARNTQPWRFVVVQGKAAVEELVDSSLPETSAMCRSAPVMIVVCARPEDDVSSNGKPYYLYDCGSAVQNLLLAATALGLVTHPLLSFDESAVRRVLNIPPDSRVVILTPLAYPLEGDYEVAAQERLDARVRKDLDELVYFNAWGNEK